MSEENPDPQQVEKQPDTEFKPITSQEDFEKALGKRLERERAKFADYDTLREKASKFDEVQEQSKSELQKAQERAAELEKRATLAEQTALKTRIAAELNVPIEVLHGNDEESIRAAAQRVIEWRDSNKPPAPSPKRLKSGSAGSADSALDGKERAAAALRRMRGN